MTGKKEKKTANFGLNIITPQADITDGTNLTPLIVSGDVSRR